MSQYPHAHNRALFPPFGPYRPNCADLSDSCRRDELGVHQRWWRHRSTATGGRRLRASRRPWRRTGRRRTVPVVTAPVVSKAVPVTIPAVGTAEPLATVQVRAQVTGQLSAIHFAEGQDVTARAPRSSRSMRGPSRPRSSRRRPFSRGTRRRRRTPSRSARGTRISSTAASSRATSTRRRSPLRWRSSRHSPPIRRRSRTPG